MLRARHPTLVIFILLFMVGCGADTATEPAAATLKTGQWHADIELPGGPVQFGLEFSREANVWAATIVNGSERIPVPVVSYQGERLSLQFPAYNNRIDAILVDGVLKGSLTLVKRYGETQVLPFSARPGARPAPPRVAETTTDLSGKWAVTFTEDDGSTYPAIGEFSQRGNRLLGTFLTETGDYRYLAGEVRGNAMQLSTFDGAHAFLFTAELDSDSVLAGNFWSGNQSLEAWQAKRDANAKLADPANLTFLKPEYDSLEFAFPDLDGQTVALSDARFDDKVVVVTLAGSWCPNCHDEAALMSELYPQYREKGVEIIALMYEHLEDPQAARTQVQRFREKFDIEYYTLLAGISDKTKAADTLPALSRVLAFPTTIFIDRNGAVRAIHTGFSGPGTGEHYLKQRKMITDELDRLVAETPANDTASEQEGA